MTPTDWPVAFFDDDYLRIYRPMLTEEQTAHEVEFIEWALRIAPASTVLDLACGYGRHAIGMARRGHRVTGVDFNARYLELAAREAETAGLDARWRQGDMRALPFEREFDAAYSFFTSFGYYSDGENEKVIAGIARALKDGGRFLIDVVNRDWFLAHPQQRLWNQREDGSLLMEETSLDLSTSRVTSRQILIEPEGGHRLAKEFDLRAYTCAELTALLRRHGLEVLGVWGSAAREPYTVESRRLILVARLGDGGAGD
jgi:SAM-dependent methyltransferase